MKKTILFLFVVAIAISCSNPKSNWDQYLGPNRNATVSGSKILSEWPPEGPKELWSFLLGPGYGGASIYNDEVFVLDRIKGESDILRCIDLNTGVEKWSYSYESKGELPYPGSRAVPTVDENFVWSVGPHGHFHCIDKKSHLPVWSHNILSEFNGELPNWGVSQSPVIYDNLIIVAPQGEIAGVVAFNKITGELVWKSRKLSGYPFHVSPTIGNYGGIDQVIMISSYAKKDSTKTDEVVAFDIHSGKELWKYEGLNSFASIAPATIIDKERLFLTECAYNGNYDPVSIMLKITREGEKFEVEELFFNTEIGCKMHPPVRSGNYLYMNSTGRPNQMECMTMDGKVVWEKGSAPAFGLGALILIDGLIINQNGKNGDIHLIKPSPEGYKEVGKASFFDSKKSQAWAPLAFGSGKLIVRDMEKMVCIDLQQTN